MLLQAIYGSGIGGMAFRARGGHPSGSPLRLLLRLAGLLVILVCSVYLTEIKQSLAAATVYSQVGLLLSPPRAACRACDCGLGGGTQC